MRVSLLLDSLIFTLINRFNHGFHRNMQLAWILRPLYALVDLLGSAAGVLWLSRLEEVLALDVALAID